MKKIFAIFILIIMTILPIYAEETDNSSDYPMIEVYKTVDEYIEVIEKDSNIDDDIKKDLIKRAIDNRQVEVYSTKPWEYYYGTLRLEEIVVSPVYRPYPYYYVKFQKHPDSPSPNRIVNIEYGNLHREYQGLSKQFSGSLFYKLIAGNELYYDLNGDFYHNGSTSIGLGVSIPIGGVATTSFNVSGSSSHFKYIHVDGEYKSSGLQP